MHNKSLWMTLIKSHLLHYSKFLKKWVEFPLKAFDGTGSWRVLTSAHVSAVWQWECESQRLGVSVAKKKKCGGTGSTITGAAWKMHGALAGLFVSHGIRPRRALAGLWQGSGAGKQGPGQPPGNPSPSPSRRKERRRRAPELRNIDNYPRMNLACLSVIPSLVLPDHVESTRGTEKERERLVRDRDRAF